MIEKIKIEIYKNKLDIRSLALLKMYEILIGIIVILITLIIYCVYQKYQAEKEKKEMFAHLGYQQQYKNLMNTMDRHRDYIQEKMTRIQQKRNLRYHNPKDIHKQVVYDNPQDDQDLHEIALDEL